MQDDAYASKIYVLLTGLKTLLFPLVNVLMILIRFSVLSLCVAKVKLSGDLVTILSITKIFR